MAAFFAATFFETGKLLGMELFNGRLSFMSASGFGLTPAGFVLILIFILITDSADPVVNDGFLNIVIHLKSVLEDLSQVVNCFLLVKNIFIIDKGGFCDSKVLYFQRKLLGHVLGNDV